MKSFFAKILLFLCVICLCQGFVYWRFPPKFPDEVIALDKSLADNVDIVYFCDSTMFSWCKEDRTTETIAVKFQKKTPGRSLHQAAHLAYHIGVYEDYCARIARSGRLPKLVIVSINLRHFSPHWDMRPEWQFEDLRISLAYRDSLVFRVFYRPLAIFKIFKMRVNREEYMGTAVFDGARKVGTVADFDNEGYKNYSDQKMKRKLIFYYMGSLTAENRKVRSLLHVVEILKSKQIPVVFYITPIDYETGTKFMGNRFRERIQENVEFIRSLLLERGVPVVDLSCALGSDLFDWSANNKYVDEHLKERGREFVAEQLFQAVSTAYPSFLEKRSGAKEAVAGL